MAPRGYLGIHAEVPTAQCLCSAIVVNGAPQIKIKIKIKIKSEAAWQPVWFSRPYTRLICGSKACSRGGLAAGLSLRPYPILLWERACSR